MSPDDFSGLALALPGIVDNRDQKILSINKKYNDAVDFDFRRWSEKDLKLPLLLMENDANAALMGEISMGTTGGVQNAALMILGTGVGTSALINGSLLRGAHYQAGCLGGHFIIDHKGSLCTCGNRGCLEAETATWAISRIVAKESGFSGSSLSTEKDIKIKQITDHARKGDALAKKILKDLIRKWSAGAVTLIHAYDPEVVVVSGGVLISADLIADSLFEDIRKNAWTPYGEIDLKISSNPEQSVVRGLNYLAQKKC